MPDDSPAGPTTNFLLAALNCKTNGSTSNLDVGWQRIHHDLSPALGCHTSTKDLEYYSALPIYTICASPHLLHSPTPFLLLVASSSLAPWGLKYNLLMIKSIEIVMESF